MLDIPPFRPDLSLTIARSSTGYSAFGWDSIEAHFGDLDFDNKQCKGDYRRVRPLFHERPHSLARAANRGCIRARSNRRRNYAWTLLIYLDSDRVLAITGIGCRMIGHTNQITDCRHHIGRIGATAGSGKSTPKGSIESPCDLATKSTCDSADKEDADLTRRSSEHRQLRVPHSAMNSTQTFASDAPPVRRRSSCSR